MHLVHGARSDLVPLGKPSDNWGIDFLNWFGEFVTSGAILAHCAAICYALGLMTRDQIVLRSLILLGTVFYILYYYIAPAMPLWDAIGWSVLLGLCNLYVMVQIALERTTFSMFERERLLYEKFHTLSPGEFRRLIRIADWTAGDGTTRLTTENEHSGNLYFLVTGTANVQKGDNSFELEEGRFIGEVGYLLSTPASGTTIAESGTLYLKWNGQELHKLERRYPGIRVALRDLINIDMAGKVSLSRGGKLQSDPTEVPGPVAATG
jgi:hypothetical protein